MLVVVKLVLMVALALVAALALFVAAHVTAMPAAAKVEPVRPQIRSSLDVDRLAVLEAEMPCMRVPPGTILRRWVPSTIETADGTVLAVGTTEIRQRC